MNLSQLIALRRPQFEKIGNQNFLNIPLLEDKKNKDLGPDRVIAFPITKKGPDREGREVYRAPDLGDPSPAEKRHAWRQAYAVWKKAEERVPAAP